MGIGCPCSLCFFLSSLSLSIIYRNKDIFSFSIAHDFITFLNEDGLFFLGFSLSFPLITDGAEESRTFLGAAPPITASNLLLTGGINIPPAVICFEE